MIQRAIISLPRNGSRHRLIHSYPTSVFRSCTTKQRFLLFERSTYGWMARQEYSPSPLIKVGLLPEDSQNPHSYTSGRWLRRDKLERNSRYIEFNFNALCKTVIELCSGAVSIASYEKKEGGFNRAFIFTMTDARRVVARLPTRIAGPPRLTTNSEVATVRYLQSKTTIPIPKILDWCDNSSNAIGSEYIIMEHSTGVQLPHKWSTMSGEQQIRCIMALMENVQQMTSIEFPAYGSLYFDDVQIESVFKQPYAPGYVIGPHCGTTFWNCNVGESRYYNSTKPNRGPWSNLAAYFYGLIDIGFSRLPPNAAALLERPSYQGSIEEHIHLLGFGRDAGSELIKLPKIQDAATPTLLHSDWNSRNIFVSDEDPTIITGIIDWQSSSIEPGFMYAYEVPDFATPIRPTSSEDATSPENQRARDKAELCSQTFDVCVKGRVPRLCAARALADDLIRFFLYCHRTWRDGAVVFREVLIDISKRWTELGLADSCPYPLPTPDQMLVHQGEMETYKIAQKLRQDLMSILETPSDGWVPTDRWEETEKAHKNAFDVLLQAVQEDNSMSEQELRLLWPFDSP